MALLSEPDALEDFIRLGRRLRPRGRDGEAGDDEIAAGGQPLECIRALEFAHHAGPAERTRRLPVHRPSPDLTLPDVAASVPERSDTSELLPAPFGPMMHTTSSALSVKLTPSTATTPP